MKGIIFSKVKELQLREDLPKPDLQPHEVLVKVKACGICGSDIESYSHGGLELPGIILGHEFAGEIVQIGPKVKGWKIGDRIAVNPGIPCRDCYWCKHHQENICKGMVALGVTINGAMAEFINVKTDRIYPLADSLSYTQAATVEPIAVSVHALHESSFKLGDTAIVLGGGTIGLVMVQLLKLAGARKLFLVDPVPSKQELGKKLGATEVFSPQRMKKIIRLTNKLGPDFIFDCAGTPQTFINSLQLIRKGGQIIITGIHSEPFEMRGFAQLILKNITQKGVYGYTDDSFQRALNLLESKKVNMDPLITSQISLEEVPKMFETLSSPAHEEIKVVITFD